MTPEKPAPDKSVPVSEFDRFDALLKRVISVPKSELDRREAEYKKQRKAVKEKRASG